MSSSFWLAMQLASVNLGHAFPVWSVFQSQAFCLLSWISSCPPELAKQQIPIASGMPLVQDDFQHSAAERQAMSVPVIGAVLFAGLVSLDTFKARITWNPLNSIVMYSG